MHFLVMALTLGAILLIVIHQVSSAVNESSLATLDQKPTLYQNPAVKSAENHHRIVGGTSASLGEIPWQGLFSASSLCGCSLLTRIWAVTAAHCTAGETTSAISIHFGIIDRSFLDPTHGYSVSEIYDHPSYDSNTLQNDISLLRIVGSVSVGGNIQTISIPASLSGNVVVGTDCLISGWGTTSADGSAPQTLLKATVPIVSNSQCNTWYNRIGQTVYNNQVCAGYEHGGIDTCQGDSGGPLACEDSSGTYILEGVTSWGIGCADALQPGVYTRVSEYVDWIKSIISVNESSVRIYGVTADGFTVTFDPVDGIVGNYTIRYSTGGAVNSVSWPDSSIRITGVNPIQNDYLVAISDDDGVTFTRDFSTKIWNIVETSENSLSFSWDTWPDANYYSTAIFTNYSLLYDGTTDDILFTNTSDNFKTFNGLSPGVNYTVVVGVRDVGDPFDTLLFAVTQVTDGACSSGLTITQDNSGMNGTITSPNYPGNYSNNLTCTWIIQAPTDKVIEVRFVDFELEACFPLLAYYDFLNVFDGEIQEYFILCGDNVPSTFVSTFGQVRFQFETDGIGTARGFRIEWKFVDVEPTCGAQNCSLHASCVNGTCECNSGFTGNATSSCDDVNECLDTVSICGSNAVCTNAIGSFSCSCIAGTTLASGSCMPIFCPEELLWYQNTSNILVMFPQTKAGRSSESLNVCPPNTANAGVPYGNRACSLDGTWLAPKWLTSCERNAQSYINQTFNSTMERQEAANDLELFTLQAQNFTADNVTTTVQALENVINAETLDQNTSSSAVATVGNLLTVSRDELEQSGQATNLFQILDSVGERVEVNTGEEFQEVSSTLAVAVVQPDPTSAEQGIGYSFRSLPFADDVGFRSDQFNTFTRSPREDASSFIQLPRDALMRSQDNRASFYAFSDDTFFRASSPSYGSSSNEFIGSELIFSATVVSATEMINFEDPVVMRFAFTSNVSEPNNFQKMCVFWNETGGGFWSSEGLVRQTITSNSAECQFNHLTNFATLFSTGSVDIPGLDLVSIIGSSVSIFCLVGLLITFAFVKKLRVGAKFRSAFLLINLSFALLFLNITLIISENIEKMSEGCKVIAVFIHFSLLASLSWMMVEGAVIYVTVVHGLYARANITDRQVITASMLWGWLMPAIVVSIVAGVDINNYSRNDAECWLRKDLVNYLSTIPAAIILAINLILYVATLTFLFRRRRPTGAKKSDVRKNVILSVTLFVTVGGSWLFGLAIPSTETYSKNASIVFAYIFTILNAFQGFFLFLLYVVRQYFTKNLFMPFIKKSVKSFTSTQSTKVFSTTQNDSAKGTF